MNIIFTYSAWLIILCIGCGALYAGVLYFRDKTLNELAKKWIIFLAILRFVSVTLVAFLLLEPLFETTKTNTEKPIIAFVHDNTESILFNKDSAFIKTEYLQKVAELKKNLQNNYELVSYTFDDELHQSDSINFSGKETNIAHAIKTINEQYYNRNLGAIILATDGIYNQGNNPFSESKKLKNIPVYTIALGDTLPIRDVLIENVLNNQLAYKGNDFPVEVVVKASDFKDKKSTLKILKNNAMIAQQEVFFNEKEFIKTISFSLEAKTIGLQKYTALIEPIASEFTTKNNAKDFYIDVLESKQKVLILANAPHPDIAQIRRAIESNKNYEVTSKNIADFDNKIAGYDLAILHNLPSSVNSIKNLLSQFETQKTPLLFVLGTQTNYTAFNKLNYGLNIPGVSSFSEAQGIINNNFTLFKVSDKLKSNTSKFPPLLVPFSQNFKLSNSCEVLANQKIGFTKTSYPLIAFNKQAGAKKGFLIGEGIWKWKYFDYLENENNANFNELITQTVQYLAAKEDKSFFRVYSKNIFKENEAIFIEAEVYNKSYELDNSNEVAIKVKNEKGTEFAFNFSKNNNRYELNAGILPAGDYSYVASTTYSNQIYTEKGEFSVNTINSEQINPVANHQLLFNISDITTGKMYFANQLDLLEKEISLRNDIVNVIYTKKEVDDLINLKWIFFLILSLISIEWFLRKRNGGY